MVEPIHFGSALRRSWRLVVAATSLQIALVASIYDVKLSAIQAAGQTADAAELLPHMSAFGTATVVTKSTPTTKPQAASKSAKAASTLVALSTAGTSADLSATLTNAYATVVEKAVNAMVASSEASQASKVGTTPRPSGFTVVEPATASNATKTVPKVNAFSSHKVRLVAGFVLGALLAGLIVLLTEVLNKTIRDARRAEFHFGYPAIADIPAKDASATGVASGIDVGPNLHTPTAEAYRKLRMAVLFDAFPPAGASMRSGDAASLGAFGLLSPAMTATPYAVPETGSRQVVLVVSASDEETRPLVVVNLAAAYGEADQRVIVIGTSELDGEGLPPAAGHFSGDITPADIEARLQPTSIEGVATLSMRSLVWSGGQLVARAGAVFGAARQVADVVIVETPPILAYHHAEALAHAVDVVLVVAECGVTRTDEARQVGTVLRTLGAPVLGVVFTNDPLGKNDPRQRLLAQPPAAPEEPALTAESGAVPPAASDVPDDVVGPAAVPSDVPGAEPVRPMTPSDVPDVVTGAATVAPGGEPSDQ